MYAPDIAGGLRNRGHDAVSAGERPDLKSAPDSAVLKIALREHRVIVTNNVRDFIQPAQQALQSEDALYGIIFTSDQSLPRSKGNIGSFIDRLHILLTRHLDEERLPAGISWLSSPSPERTIPSRGTERTTRNVVSVDPAKPQVSSPPWAATTTAAPARSSPSILW